MISQKESDMMQRRLSNFDKIVLAQPLTDEVK